MNTNTAVRSPRVPIRGGLFASHMRVNVHSHAGQLNRVVGWWGILLGLGIGLWMGLWAFDGPLPAPPGFEDPDALPRRLLRLGHIAAVAVGALNVLFAREIDRLELSCLGKRVCSILAAVAWPGIVLGCVVAAFIPPAKYLLPLGALSLIGAVALAAVGASRPATTGRTP